MKMKPEHYETLQVAVQKVLDTYPGALAEYRRKGFSDKRFRWDALYACGLKIGDGVGTEGLPLYAYLNDDHIDSALRKITGTK